MFLTDVIVELGYATRERVDEVIQEARIAGRSADELLVEQQADRRRPALAGDRRALRARPRRPQRLPRRHGRGEPALGRRRAPLPGRPGRLRRLQDPARRDRRSRERPRDRRHPHDHRPQLPGRGRRGGRHRGADPPPQHARARGHRGRSTRTRRASSARSSELRESADDAPVIKLVYSILGQAATEGASDIHFEPGEDDMRVRFRVDGVLYEAARVPKRMVSGVVSRIKIMSELDIAEKRVPQDGRVGVNVEGRKVDLRVITLPTQRGEGATIRILDKEQALRSLDELGMDGERPRALPGARSASSPRRGPGHRPDRLGQVDVALRGARRAQLGREEDHHDRGPGRVPDRRRQPDERQPQGRARRSRPACARSCAPTPTSSWSARSATPRPRGSRSSRR